MTKMLEIEGIGAPYAKKSARAAMMDASSMPILQKEALSERFFMPLRH